MSRKRKGIWIAAILVAIAIVAVSVILVMNYNGETQLVFEGTFVKDGLQRIDENAKVFVDNVGDCFKTTVEESTFV
ncbi:MAG TPA: hypothetical protein VHP81_10660 [Lachnospiraceae bacterium]|nr:hypothetical protein [Lachnospiraceae bacterium]